MAQRFKVLISAYACEPNKGSEPEVGWQWALQMARFHQVTVLTRSNNRAAIEAGLAAQPPKQPAPEFVFHDLPRVWLKFKRRSRATQLYYLLWQRSARKLIGGLHRQHAFDLMHHVTFAAYRYPVAISGHRVPWIWGPVGGIESIPVSLLPWRHPASLVREATRNLSNVFQANPYSVLPRRARAATLRLASTLEMRDAFARLGFAAELMPAVGLQASQSARPRHPVTDGPLKLLYVGNIIGLKGIDLALEALKASSSNATFTLAGDGNYLAGARRLAQQLRLENRVHFLGRLPRDQVLRLYADYHVFLFPSLHDTGGYALLEAMDHELPVICLDCGGPRLAVDADRGRKIPLGERAEVVRGLAAAIEAYDRDRASILSHGAAARQAVLRDYDWDTKGRQMDLLYRQALGGFDAERAQQGEVGTGKVKPA